MNSIRQGLILNGDQMASIAEHHNPSLLSGIVGAGLNCLPYSSANCPSGTPEDTTYCVQIVDVDMGVNIKDERIGGHLFGRRRSAQV